MTSLTKLTDAWQLVKELDLNPLRQQALNGVCLAVVGNDETARTTLTDALLHDPLHPEHHASSPILSLDLEKGKQAAAADLIILILGSPQAGLEQDYDRVKKNWRAIGRRLAKK